MAFLRPPAMTDFLFPVKRILVIEDQASMRRNVALLLELKVTTSSPPGTAVPGSNSPGRPGRTLFSAT